MSQNKHDPLERLSQRQRSALLGGLVRGLRQRRVPIGLPMFHHQRFTGATYARLTVLSKVREEHAHRQQQEAGRARANMHGETGATA